MCAEMPLIQTGYSMHVPWVHHRWADSQLHFVTPPTNKSVVTGVYLNVSRHIKIVHCFLAAVAIHCDYINDWLMNPLGSCYSLTDDVCLPSRYIQWVVNRLTSRRTTGVFTVLHIAHNWCVFSFYCWYQKSIIFIRHGGSNKCNFCTCLPQLRHSEKCSVVNIYMGHKTRESDTC